MSSDQITADVSARICAHMNGDHAEAVIDYARYYGGIEAPKTAKMIAITPELIKLEVDEKLIEIKFDHTLTDSEDAHQTLIAMLKTIPKSSC
ncbi:MAG: DUF2470 domain-containing protein [Prochlorococcus sp.]|jgi:putative heme iron utilization protein|tara:strand:+ start:1944 stop:2219 length:276 start_codon:yes stop_codon:yes gene_type:complete